MGDIFQLKKGGDKKVLKYLQDEMIDFTVQFALSQFGFPCFPKRFTFLFLFVLKFLSTNLSFTFEFFSSVHTILAGFTSGPGGRLGARPCSRPWAGSSASVPAGLISAGCCLVPRAAGLAGACCRAGLPAAGRTARAAAAPAWAAAEAQAAQAWPPRGR